MWKHWEDKVNGKRPGQFIGRGTIKEFKIYLNSCRYDSQWGRFLVASISHTVSMINRKTAVNHITEACREEFTSNNGNLSAAEGQQMIGVVITSD